VLKSYNLNNYDTPRDLVSDFLSDFLFHCPSQFIASKMAEDSTYTYQFTHLNKAPLDETCEGVCAGEELPYLFTDMTTLLGKGESDLSARMMAFWAMFAKEQDPTSNTTKLINEVNSTTDFNITGSGNGTISRNIIWPASLNTDVINTSSILAVDYYVRLDTAPNLKVQRGRTFARCDVWAKIAGETLGVEGESGADSSGADSGGK